YNAQADQCKEQSSLCLRSPLCGGQGGPTVVSCVTDCGNDASCTYKCITQEPCDDDSMKAARKYLADFLTCACGECAACQDLPAAHCDGRGGAGGMVGGAGAGGGGHGGAGGMGGCGP